MRWVCGVAWAVWACGCGPAAETTETVVLVDADAAVRKLTARLRAQVLSVENDKVRFDEEFDAHWPVRLAVLPIDGDSDREFSVRVEALRSDGSTLVSGGVRAGFVADRKRYVHLLLEEPCLARSAECDGNSTCRDGVCVSA